MSLLVDFVGIIYFDGDPAKPGNRDVLIIDGSDPDDGIAEHVATINIAPGQILGRSGWDQLPRRAPLITERTIDLTKAREVRAQMGRRIGNAAAYVMPVAPEADSTTMVAEVTKIATFTIPSRSTITITGLTGKGVDASQHNDRLPKLKDLDPPVFVDLDRAEVIARLTISNGKLIAQRLLTANGNGAIVSRLLVDGDLGPIAIVVEDREAKVTRTITVADGTEIVIANVSSEIDLNDAPTERAHYQLYRKLSPDENGKLIQADPVVPPGAPDFLSEHPFFADALDHPEERCSNTCCGRKG